MQTLEPPAPARDRQDHTIDELSSPTSPARTERITEIISWVVAIAAAGFVFSQLHPELILRDSTPAGGDMGAHVWGPAYLRDHLLPDLRLSGWTPDWYAGFPAFHFYMVVPMLAIVALDVLLPYGIAFKLVAVSGVVALPMAAWFLARRARLPFPGPPLFAVGAVFFLFDRSFTIYGGNLASTLAGEFAFAISLSLSLFYLGSLIRLLDTGRGRAVTSLLFGLTALTHVIPAIFAVAASVVLFLMRPDRDRFKVGLTVGFVGAGLAAFWALPFIGRRAYLNDMGWEKITTYRELLLPDDLHWVAAFAAAGVIAAIGLRVKVGVWLTLVALVMAFGVVVAPQGRLWNARIVPFWYLALYLLAAVAVTEIIRAMAATIGANRTRSTVTAAGAWAGTAVIVFVSFVVVGRPVDAVPSWLDPIVPDTTDRSFIPGWAAWNFSGYEGKDAYPEYHAVVTTMDRIGDERGCGRAMWEYESDLNRFGTPMALMLLPHWTDGCIGSMEGLYFEASATTPYHFLIQSELSSGPSRPQRGLPYDTVVSNIDANSDGEVTDDEKTLNQAVFDAGVEHMQMLGVRYYLAFTPVLVDAAERHPDLTEVGATTGWTVFEVADHDIVVGLDAQPVIADGVASGGEEWQHFAITQFQRDDPDAVLVADDGPAEWRRLSYEAIEDEASPLPLTRSEPAQVSAIETGTDFVRFEVDEPGRPVLVKVSYFPNWKVTGADGPYRVAPNLMVVVPTETEVELTYGRTTLDIASMLITLAALVALVALAKAGPVALPAGPTWWRRQMQPLAEAFVASGRAGTGEDPGPSAEAHDGTETPAPNGAAPHGRHDPFGS